MMKLSLYKILIISATILLTANCGKREHTSVGIEEYETLYHNTLKLIEEYRNKLTVVDTDSATVISDFNRFNTKLDSINFTVSADTDLHLSEGQNDTIYNSLIQLRRLYEERLNEMSINTTDTCQLSTIS